MCGCNHNHSTKNQRHHVSLFKYKTLPSASGVLVYHSFTVYTSAGSNSHEPSKIVGNFFNGACAALFPGLQLVGHTCAIITLCKCTLCKQGKAGNEARVTQQTNNSESLSRWLGQKSPRAPKRCVSPLKLSGSV